MKKTIAQCQTRGARKDCCVRTARLREPRPPICRPPRTRGAIRTTQSFASSVSTRLRHLLGFHCIS